MTLNDESSRPVFLGFAAKIPHRVAPGEFGAADVVCSVSSCISKLPTGWDDAPFEPPALNGAYLASSVEDARKRTPAAEAARSAIFAYRAFPVVFGFDGTSVTIDRTPLYEGHGPGLPTEADLSGMQLLGFDVTEYPSGCSPLSCNGKASEHQVNRFCLLDDATAAHQVAQNFARERPEPGPYIIVEVWGEGSLANQTAR
jgi:hypothetical protein